MNGIFATNRHTSDEMPISGLLAQPMLIAAITVIVLAFGLIGYLLWRAPRPLTAGSIAFATMPAIVGAMLVGRWHNDPLAIGLGLILVLIGVYSANRLHAGH